MGGLFLTLLHARRWMHGIFLGHGRQVRMGAAPLFGLYGLRFAVCGLRFSVFRTDWLAARNNVLFTIVGEFAMAGLWLSL